MTPYDPEAAVAEFWTKIKGHDVSLHSDMTTWLRAALSRAHASGKRDGELKTFDRVCDAMAKSWPGSKRELDALKDAARADGVEIE